MPRLSKIGAAALAAFGWTGLQSVTASYLVVAGGGGSSGAGTGGGGAGGLLTGTATLNPTQSYTVTVGAGGAGTFRATTNNGSNSVFNSITSTGGGGGGYRSNGKSGGSGGGGGAFGVTFYNGGAGTSGQGNAGGNAGGANWVVGGGGGAGAVGANGASGQSGAGGVGVASSISGSSTYYAGGGGGGGVAGSAGTATGGAGGNGGGGGGASSNGQAGTAGTANTGGGGGGGVTSDADGTGGSGGSGVVIISYPAPQQFGGGTVTQSGGNFIHTFNTSGTLSPLSSVTASYLVVAGGAGGGSRRGSGGGASQVLTGSATLDTNSIYTITVGAGGAGGAGGSGNNGSAGTVSTILLNSSALGAGGGSDGGAAGASGSGKTGGSSGGAPNYGGGGGGGDTANGSNGTTTAGGAGGAGTANSISGSSVTYAGGGGGGTYDGGTGGSGGSGGGGGGGSGANPATAGTAGTANTGSGGGGGGHYSGSGGGAAGGAGGSGVVIISYAGATQQMAGGTVTITGGNVIHTFTSSGYLTPIKLVNNSLRFRSSASAYFSRTLTTPTNNKIFTWSGWLKLGKLSDGYGMLSTTGTGAPRSFFVIDSNTLWFLDQPSGTNANLNSVAVLRDPSAWYHIVFAVDTTQATSTNRVKMYINGVQATLTGTYPTQNTNPILNSATAHTIGSYSINYYDGYMTEINFIDGQQLTPNSFGTFNSYGVWQPITYGGSYGTNGFYLPFTNKTSTTTLGYDFSPNGNNWTPNNISVTAGATYDSMTDVPTLTSATAANYCVMNPLNKTYSTYTLSDGNLNWTSSTINMGSHGTFQLPTSGKYYWEVVMTANAGGSPAIGIADGLDSLGNKGIEYRTSGNKEQNGGVSGNGSGAYGATWTTNDVIGVAYDADTSSGQITFYKNNSSQGVAYSSIQTNFPNGLFPSFQNNAAGTTTFQANFGQRPFAYTPPAGFVALNTYNL